MLFKGLWYLVCNLVDFKWRQTALSFPHLTSYTTDEYLVYKPTLDKEGTSPILRKKLGKKEKTMILSRGAGHPVKNIVTPKSRRRRFCLHDEDAITLAKWAKTIEQHYSRRRGTPVPMDIEWAKDGKTGKLYIVQARPETVQSQKSAAQMVEYNLVEECTSEPLVKGTSVGTKILHGEVCVVHDVHDLASFRPGCILVTEITDPDWVPIMKQASGIVTDHGGRTCHGACKNADCLVIVLELSIK